MCRSEPAGALRLGTGAPSAAKPAPGTGPPGSALAVSVTADSPGGQSLAKKCRGELAGILSIVVAACAYMAPGLKDGARFGSFNFVIPLTSLGAGTYRQPPFNHLNSDVVSQMNAWNLLDWRQLHAGHFPLWNSLSLLGLPQFLNFESAVLSLPDLVSYAVPLRDAFFVAVLAKALIAGTGAYLLARLLGLSPLGASFAGVSFMLSGAFANWLSWPLSDVVAWLGWIVSFAICTYRFAGRTRYVCGLAVSVALCLYGGFPEADAFVAVSVVVMALAFVTASWALGLSRRESPVQRFSGSGALAGATRVGGGALVGVLLALPLWWPGLQIIGLAHRQTEGGFPGLPARSLALFVAQGYYGLPTRSNPFFLAGSNYYESVSYVGVVMVVLALVAVARWWRHPTVLALVALCVVALAISYQTASFHPVLDFLNLVAGQVQWARFRSVIGLPLGLLGGLGIETLWRRWRTGDGYVAFVIATVLMGIVVVVLASHGTVGKTAVSVRDRSLIWPAGLVGICLFSALAWGIALSRDGRPGRYSNGAHRAAHREITASATVGALWLGSAGFLVFAGVGVNSYSHRFYPGTPAISELRHYVGHHLVGLDDGKANTAQDFVPVGFYPEVNLAYGVTEFAGHDPVLPQGYFSALVPGTGRGGPGFFEPDIDSVSVARRYGISYVLALRGLPRIAGARFVAAVAGEQLYFVPGASRFTVSGGGHVTRVRQASPSQYDLRVRTGRGESRARLLIRVTDVPGWHATINGRPVELARADKVMMSLPVPAGSNEIRLWYWPTRLTEGLGAAGLGVVVLVAWAVLSWRRRRRRPLGGEVATAAGQTARDLFSLAVLLAAQREPRQ
ncbi:MAG: YfhO family protein [Acidimicrobiales bacterium]